jgi:hypothetical protein
MKDFIDECYLAWLEFLVAIHDLFTFYPVLAPLVLLTTIFVIGTLFLI